MKALRDTYVENTRRALLDSAVRMFAERDFGDVSAQELVADAGLTRGALYHHFDGKRGLFEAVFEDLERAAAQRISAAIDSASEPFARADRGAAEFLDVCAEDTYRHVVLLQGPIALGWRRWRELDQHHLGGIVIAALHDLLDAGLVGPHPVELLTSAFYGALTELSMTIAESDDPPRARAQAARLHHELLAGLCAGSPSSVDANRRTGGTAR